MPSPLDEDTIAAIRRLAGEGVSAYRIGKTLHVSAGSVQKYAAPGSFDRSATATAVKAHQLDAAARRAVQRQRYLDIVDELQNRLGAPYEHAVPAGAEGEIRRWSTPRPPARETADLMRAASTATMAELRIADHDSDGGIDESRGLVRGFMDAIAQRAADLADPPQ